MMADASNDDIYLKTVFSDPFTHRGVVWAEHTSVETLQKCEKFRFHADDVIVVTYPRSGTSLMQEIVWHIVNHKIIKKDEKYGSLHMRVPFLEMDLKYFIGLGLIPPESLNPVDLLPLQPSKRLIKTHLPYFFIRDEIEKAKPKIVVVMRNPKDNVVSSYNFFKGLKQLKEGLSFFDYWKAYMDGKVINGDYCDFNLQYWALRDRENVLIVHYEDIAHQPFQIIRNVASFLDYSLSADEIATIIHNTTFAVMSKDEDTNIALRTGPNRFMRKGKVGDWKDWLTVAQNEAMDAWISERLSGADLRFTFE